jgi:hypothetical protein
MTVGWAIVIVAVLYLLDKYGALKKTLKMASIVAVIAAFVFAVVIAVGYTSDRWKDHKFAKAHECFNPSTGKANPASGSSPWCADDEQLREHVTVTFDTSPVKPITPDADGWEPVPPSPSGVTLSPAGATNTPHDEYNTPIPPGATSVPPSGATIDPGSLRRIICYNEATNTATDVPLKNGHAACKPPSIFMQQVK